MFLRSMILLGAMGISTLGVSLTEEDCGRLFHCTMEMDPHQCEDVETGASEDGDNRCKAFFNTFAKNCEAKIEFDTSSIQCERTGDFILRSVSCPVLINPGPDFCPNGILTTEKDARGCERPVCLD